MLGVTVFGLICGVAVKYPEESLAIFLLASSMMPTAGVVLMLVSFSRHRMITLMISCLGAVLLGGCCAPARHHMGPGPKTVWEAVRPDLLPMAIFPPLGALLFGGAILLDEHFEQRRKADPP